MKLMNERECFYVECHTDSFGYKSNDCYVFPSKEELENFLGMNDDYENNIYKHGTDIYGQKRSIGSNEYPSYIYSKIEYHIEE